MKPLSSYYVYIVRCADKTLYTGITTDITRRIAEHNTGMGAKYTRSRGPVTLVHSEEYKDRSSALKREAEIKKMSRANKIALAGLSQ